MKKLAFSFLFIFGFFNSGFSQNIALGNLSKTDNWKELTHLIEIHDILNYIHRSPFKETHLHNIPAGYPLDRSIYINSFYGSRHHPVHKVTKFHHGVDLKGGVGEKVFSTGDGTVIEAGFKSDLGNYVRIRHQYGFESLYGHLNKILVKRGQRISQRQLIGKIGATGTVTGPHLHYTLKKNDQFIDPFDFLFLESTPEGITLQWNKKGTLT